MKIRSSSHHRSIIVICLTAAWGCGASGGLPTDLPALPAAPSPPPKAIVFRPTSASMHLIDANKELLTDAGSTKIEEQVHSRITFKVPRNAPPPKRVHLRIGKRSRDGRFTIHGQASGKPVGDMSGEYHVEIDIRTPASPGDYLIQAIIANDAFTREPLVEQSLKLTLPKEKK